MVKNEKYLQVLSKQKVNHRCLVFITPRKGPKKATWRK